MLHIAPIFHTLMRRKLSVLLMVIQIAITTAIFSNLGFMIGEINRVFSFPTGFNEHEMFTITLRPLRTITYVDTQYDLQSLSELTGVANAAAVRWIPLNGNAVLSNIRIDLTKEINNTQIQKVNVSPRALETLGIRLIHGRNFIEEDMDIESDNKKEGPHNIIISKQLAEALFGQTENAIGKTVYEDNNAREIIGVTENSLGFTRPFGLTAENTAYYPAYDESETEFRYLVHTKTPQAREQVIESATQLLMNRYQNQLVLYVNKIDDIKLRPEFGAQVMMHLLIAFTIVLGLVIAFAIGGQTLFSVNQRIKQIGIHRALGASRVDIIVQLLLENTMICALGLQPGIILSLLVNKVAMQVTQSSPIPPLFIIITCLIILSICLIGAAIPAWKAGQIAPSVATRTV